MFLPSPTQPGPVNWMPQPPAPRTENLSTLQKVERMTSDELTQALARENGMVVQSVSWEDTARNKNSCWGPNISDMTLQVKDDKGEYHRMPVIRQPNYTDKTQDVAIDTFSVMVGNEKGQGVLTRITLRQYINEIMNYLHTDDCKVKGPMLCERDNVVINSVQACFLPAELGKAVDFNVALYNYQSYEGNPAVLTIVLSNHGASAQIIDNGRGWAGQKLVFDKNGKACDFVAERLKDVRANAGAVVQGAMNQQEEAQSKLFIVQIPLKVAPRPMRSYGMLECAGMPAYACAASAPMFMAKSANIDYAQISVGKEDGPFPGLKGIAIERDTQYPIRVTTQLYRLTDDGNINREQMTTIVAEIKKEEEKGKNASSLVLEQTNRPTEWVKV